MTRIYEYGIRRSHDGGLHREGMTEEEATLWVDEWLEMGGKEGAFIVVRRELGPWEVAEEA